MTKKYVDIKRENVIIHDMFDDEEQDVIFYYHWFDTLYDHKNEDMGHFYDIGFEKDGEVLWQTVHTGDYVPSFDYKYLENVNPGNMFGLYINKNKKKDIEIKHDKEGYQVIIYKNRYRFNGNPSYN